VVNSAPPNVIDGRPSQPNCRRKSLGQIFAVLVGREDLASLDTSHHWVVQGTHGIKSRPSWYGETNMLPITTADNSNILTYVLACRGGVARSRGSAYPLAEKTAPYAQANAAITCGKGRRP
jgi:hypothetical protein